MVEPLLDEGLLLGKSAAQVDALLGRPGAVSHREFSKAEYRVYYVGPNTRWLAAGDELLVVRFAAGSAAEAFVAYDESYEGPVWP